MEIVSPITSSQDYIRKLNLYADAGVREYWMADPLEEQILVYYLETEKFKFRLYTFQDKIPVNIFDGLNIDFS